MAEAEKEEAPKEGAEGAVAGVGVVRKSKIKTLLPFVMGTALAGGFAYLAAFVIWPKPVDVPTAEEIAAADKKKPPATPLDQFEPARAFKLPLLIVGLADEGQAVAGRISIMLEVRTTKEREPKIAEECGETGALHPKIRDALLTLFSGKVSADLKPAHGKELLKLEILDLLGSILFPERSEGAITGVYFTEFLVQ